MSRKTARDVVADHVRSRILSGALEPGRKLGVVEFADALDVSQTPTREAFQLLASEGLVEIHAYRGAYVAELSADEYEELFVMRVGLEARAGELGTRCMDDERVALARTALDDMRRACELGDVDDFVRADRRFHEAHYLASGRTKLWERVMTLRFASERYTRLGFRTPQVDMASTVATHTAILAAVEARDAGLTGELIVDDLRRTFDVVHPALGGRPDPLVGRPHRVA